jgi:hypothetical protein
MSTNTTMETASRFIAARIVPDPDQTETDLPASEREIGELIGKVDSIGEQIAEMQRRNSAEHESVIGAIRDVRVDLSTKASENWVKEHETRIDSLEAIRDEGKGAARLVRFVQGALGAAVVVLGYLATNGGVQ